MGKTISIEEHLKKIDKTGDCWIWNGHVNVWGYGTFGTQGTTKFAHRVMWERANNKSAHGLIVRHTCDNPPCCNPDHLIAGTHQENQADKIRKMRQAKGIHSGSAKLTEKDVIEIRKLYETTKTTYKKLADKFNVCRDTIQKIIKRKYWRHVWAIALEEQTPTK